MKKMMNWVGTLQAGADIVLGPQNFVEAFDAVVKAVETAGSPSSASTRACAAF